jgi:enoyl-CoA hydratase/carnithine racemase
VTGRVTLERDGAIATVVIEAPARLNALSQSMWQALGSQMNALSADGELRCVILRGAGEAAFAAGADIAEFPRVRADSPQGKAYGELIAATMRAVGECVHPTIARIHGACVGGGLEIALMCDLRICGRSSRFGIPVQRLGLTMGYGELEGLLAVVSPATALEILLEGRVFDAQEAKVKGLVHRVVDDADIDADVAACAARIVAGAPLVARWHKRFIRRLREPRPLSPEERDEGYACFDSEDYAEGVRAFLAARAPSFKGR